jgi:hypothetical protein
MQIRFKAPGLRAQEVVVGQLGFFDLNRRYEGLNEKNDPLVAIAAMVPFESFRAKLKAALIKGEEVYLRAYACCVPHGRCFYRLPLVMLRHSHEPHSYRLCAKRVTDTLSNSAGPTFRSL